jgi:hypothetical protein
MRDTGGIGSVGEVAGDEKVEGRGRLGAGGRDGEAAGIEMHGVVPGRVVGMTASRGWVSNLKV